MMKGHNSKVKVSVNSLNTDELKTLKKAILEMGDSYTRVTAERELQKEILEEMEDKLGVEKKIIRKIAAAYYKANFAQIEEENRQFEEGYEKVSKIV